MASCLKADVVILKMKEGHHGKMAEIMVRRSQKDGIKLDIKMIVLGDVGSGKSTLVSSPMKSNRFMIFP
jgi:GTPase